MLSVSIDSNSQDLPWVEFDIDALVSVSFPGEGAYELDTILQRLKVYQLYTTIDDVTFVAQKSPCDVTIIDKNLSRLPHDKKSLLKYYDAITKGMANDKNSSKVVNNEINNSGLFGRKAIFKDSLGYVFYECHLYVLEDNLYKIGVFSDGEYEHDLKNMFFSFMEIKNPQSINQYLGKSPEYRQGSLFSIFLFALLGIIGIAFILFQMKLKM